VELLIADYTNYLTLLGQITYKLPNP